jgi:hypothetical protein
MDPDAITKFITDTFDGVDVVVASGNAFYFYDPDHRFPFATLVTSDIYDRSSNLDRPSVFRLNIGVSGQTYRKVFGPQPSPPSDDGVVDTGHDFTALDQLKPHPVYAPQSWVCVLNPTEVTFQTVQPLLAEAYERSVKRQARARRGDEA